MAGLVWGKAPLNQHHIQRENLGVEQTKGSNQHHAERRNWLSGSSPIFRAVPTVFVFAVDRG